MDLNNPTPTTNPPVIPSQPQPAPIAPAPASNTKNLFLLLGGLVLLLIIIGGGVYILISNHAKKTAVDSLTMSDSPTISQAGSVSAQISIPPTLTPNPDYTIKDFTVRYVNASFRYYVTKNGMPWSELNKGGVTGCSQSSGIISGQVLSNNPGKACMQALINAGELTLLPWKDEEKSLRRVYVSGTDDGVTACYAPESDLLKSDPNTNRTAAGVVRSGCPSSNSSDPCYWCASL